MPALTRVTQKIFASALTPAGNVAVIGSAAALAPAYSADLNVVQSLAQYLSGFNAICIGDRSPAKQDMNALMLLVTSQLAYILERGLPEYDAGTTYYIGDMCRVDGAPYTAVANNLTGSNPSVDTNNWASGLGKFQAGVITGGSQLVPVDGAGHILEFDSEVSDPYGCFDPVTYKYTAAARGDYLVSGSLQVDNSGGDAATMELAFRAVKNGAAVVGTGGEAVANPPGSRWYPKIPSLLVTLAAGDTLEFQLSATTNMPLVGNVQVSNSSCAIVRI